jgi:hypothetical protein
VDKSNPAAQNLMGCCVLTLGITRLAAALDPSIYTGFASAALMNRSIKPLEGWDVALSSFVFAGAWSMI